MGSSITWRGSYGCGLLLLATLLLANCGKSKTAAEYLRDAQAHRSAGNISAAIIDLKNALQQNSGDAQARVLLGRYYLDVGDGVGAEVELLRARQDGADPTALAKPLAEAELMLGKPQAALQETELAGSLPGELKASLKSVRGRALLALGRRDEARQALEAGLSDDPHSADILSAMIRYGLTIGDLAMAQERLRDLEKEEPASANLFALRGAVTFASGAFRDSEDAFREMLRLEPWNLSARLGLARAQVAGDRLAEAEASLSIILKQAPNDPNANYLRALTAYRKKDYAAAQASIERTLASQKEFAPALLLAGATSYALNQLEQAARYLGQYVHQVPQDLQGRKLLAAAQVALGRSGEAVKTLSSAAENSDDAQLLGMIGIASARSGDLAKADRYLLEAVKRQPDNAELRMQLGLAQVALGQKESGIEELEQAVRRDPGALPPEIALFSTYFRDKEFDKAIEVGERIEKSRPTDAVGFDLAGFARLAKGDAAAARTDFLKARDLHAGDPIANRSLAALSIRDGNNDTAAQYYEEILTANPKDVRTYIDLSELYVREARPEQARAVLGRAIAQNPDDAVARVILARMELIQGKAEEALATIDPIRAKYPTDAGVLEVAGRAQLALRKNTDAIASFGTLVDVLPQSSVSHRYLAEAYLASDDAEHARSEANKSLKLDPKDLGANAVLARAYIAGKRDDEAAKLSASLAERFPENAGIADLRGNIEMQLGRPQQAVTAYARAISLADSGEHRIHLAAAQAKAGQTDAAQRTLTEWIQGHPDDPAARMALGDFYLQEGRNSDAEQQYSTVLRQQPNSAVAENNVAWVLSLEGRGAEALEHARHAASLDPHAAQILDTFGVVLLQNRKAAEAVEALAKAAQTAPAALEIRFHFAQALAQAGDKQKAREVLRGLLASSEPFQERERAQKLLGDLGS